MRQTSAGEQGIHTTYSSETYPTDKSNGFSGTFSFWHLQDGTTAGRVGSCKHPQANPNPPGGMRESPDRGGLDPATRRHPRAVGAHFDPMWGGGGAKGLRRNTGGPGKPGLGELDPVSAPVARPACTGSLGAKL